MNTIHWNGGRGRYEAFEGTTLIASGNSTAALLQLLATRGWTRSTTRIYA